jgi:flagellar basal-body rod modification protein FlgD
MQVQPASAVAGSTTQASAQAPQTKGEQDFQTFLKLLTAQMRHQDPLEPLDATQFVAQLAAFSSVEQQIETNTKLETINEKLSRLEYLGIGDDAGSGYSEASEI